MMLSPKKFREVVVQILFCFEVGEGPENELIPTLMKELCLSKSNITLAYKQAIEVFKSRDIFDEKVKASSLSYNLERVGKVERSVLRYILYLISLNTLPRAVLIDEALRLTTKFSTKDAASYVHAILEASKVSDASICA